MTSSYRPHNPGHDYYDRGIYLITLVVTERQPILSQLPNRIPTTTPSAENTAPTSKESPSVILNPIGAIVAEEWEKTAAIQSSKGRRVIMHAQVCMPDHWHGVIEVTERMDISLGAIINAFKSVCTSRWRKEVTGYVQPPCTATFIRHANHERRRAFYATRPLIERPLFDDDYDDTICLNERHKQGMIRYVFDNVRRAVLRRLLPQFFERRLHVVIAGRDYAAFGNLFLLRWPRKLQVFCHRMARLSMLTADERQRYGYAGITMLPADEERYVTRVPYHTTDAFAHEQQSWVDASLNGATVLVTPGISKGEQAMKNLALERRLPLIHLQQESIGPYWKPELTRFETCQQGSLLILAPWQLDDLGAVNGVPSCTDYSHFHNLNALAKMICEFEGEARIVR